MKKFYYLTFTFICVFCSCLVFAKDEVIIKSIIPVYDEESTIVVNDDNSVVFNDKDQEVKYNVVIENTMDKDIPIEDINLTKPSESFLLFEFDGLNENEILKANSTKEVVVSLTTIQKEGWGRNFNDELLVNISYDGSLFNPNTSVKDILVVLTCLTFITGVLILSVKSRKLSRYAMLLVMFGTFIGVVKAKEILIVPIKINASYESQNVMMKNNCVVDPSQLAVTDCESYWVYSEQIRDFYIENEVVNITDYSYKFDVSEKQDNRVIVYLVDVGNGFYDLYLNADGLIYANIDASKYFFNMTNLKHIYNLEGLDTSNVNDMTHMFAKTGYYSNDFELDLTGLDTSNVTNMTAMFDQTAFNSENFVLNLESFDTSSVETMLEMFCYTGYSANEFVLDLSSFNTEKVTDMSGMFANMGFNAKNLDLKLGYNFDTSKVTNMYAMFLGVAYSSEKFHLDLGDKFDTSNVIDMSGMFNNFARTTIDLVLDLGDNFDTSKVNNMYGMFTFVGCKSNNFVLDLGDKFDTSNVTSMREMFAEVGFSNTNFTLDLGDKFDMSKVTDTVNMLGGTGSYSNSLNLVLNILNNNITSYSGMFLDTAKAQGSKITINYTKESEELVDKMIATKSRNANVVKGKMIVDVDNLSIEDEVHISGEKFNVVNQNDDTITLLTKYNLGNDYRQSTSENYVLFANNTGWEYSTGKNEIDISAWSSVVNTYINEYVDYISDELSDDSVTGDLMTLKQLSSLGCVIPANYEYVADSNGRTCSSSEHIGWINNNQSWWTKSAVFEYPEYVWIVGIDNHLGVGLYNYSRGIRPVITISKESLKEYVGV